MPGSAGGARGYVFFCPNLSTFTALLVNRTILFKWIELCSCERFHDESNPFLTNGPSMRMVRAKDMTDMVRERE